MAKRSRPFVPSRRAVRAVAEALESRRMLSGHEPVIIDDGFPSEPSDPNFPSAFQIRERWSSTASGSTGSTGTGLTLTWSVVPDGTTISSGVGEPAAPSDLQARLNAIYGSPLEWMPIFQEVFDSWSAISGVTFVQDNDDGVATSGLNSARGVLGVRGDIRIGAHFINGAFGTIAYNWFPDRGDMVIDSADLGPGGFLLNTSNNSRRLKNVMEHEIGHALGFDHVEPVDGTKLMEATAATGFDGPQFDDMYTVNRNYGDFFEKSGGNNSAATAINRGIIGGTTDFIDNLSLATTSDNDFFKFTLDSTRDVTITIAPFGPTYLEGPQTDPPTTPTSFNAQAQMNLQAQLLASNGSTVLATANATGVGQSELLTMPALAAGTYYIKVMPAPGASNSAQIYTLSNAVSGAGVISTTVALTGGNDLAISDTAIGGKTDNLTVVADTSISNFVISDPINFIGTSIPGATGNGTHTVQVPFAAVSGGDVIISLLGGNDRLSVTSASMPFAVDGGAGADILNIVETNTLVPVSIVSSLGNDTINVNADNAGVARATLAVSQTIGTLAVGSGGVAALAGVAGGSPEVLVIKNFLKLTGTGKLDLMNNDLALSFYTGSSPTGAWNGSNYNGVTGLIKSGRAGGAWSGNGLITTQSAAVGAAALTALGVAEASQALGISGNQTALFDGQTVDASSVLVRYTFAGDADLKDAIDGDDFFRIDAGYTSATPRWFNGDFDYNGLIDADDYFVIDSNYSKDTAILAAPPAPLLAPQLAFAPVDSSNSETFSYRRPIDDILI